MKPFVSILMPAYNAERWIAQSLESAIAQTWPDTEIIVVDDGSTDQTLSVARQYDAANVTIVTQPNQGAAAARNKAFALSRGEYIQWLDADDILARDKIARQVNAVTRCTSRRTLLSAAWAPFLWRHDRARFKPTALWADLPRNEWLFRKLAYNLHMQTATWLVSRELTESAGPWDTRLLGDDDGEYFCRVLLQSDGVRFVPESKVFYRMAGSASLSYLGHSDKKLDAHMHSMELHIGYLRSLEDSERARAACVQYLQNWLIHFYPERLDIVRRAEKMAEGLGGRLCAPQLSWKYRWIRALFGWHAAKRSQLRFRQIKWSTVRLWDKFLFDLHNADRLAFGHETGRRI